jgi:hypothetical protein
MVVHFDHLGVVEVRPGPTDTKAFPAELEVEDRHKPIHDVMSEHKHKDLSDEERKQISALRGASHERAAHGGAPGVTGRVDISGIDKFHRFPLGLPVQFK